MKKICAALLCALLALTLLPARPALAEEIDMNRYVIPMPTGESPSYEAWMAALNLPGIEGYGIYGYVEGHFAQASDLILIFDGELAASGLSVLGARVAEGAELAALAAGECLIPARVAEELNLSLGDAFPALDAAGAEYPLTVGGIYADLEEGAENYWPYVFVAQDAFLSIVGRDSADAVFVNWVLMAADADPAAYARAADEAMLAQNVAFFTYEEYMDLFAGQNDLEYEGALTVFDGTDLYGEALPEQLLVAGGVTMVNIWATFCNPCIEEMPHLQALSESYAQAGAPLRIVGVCGDLHDFAGNLDEDAVALGREIADLTGVTYLNVIPGERLRQDLLAGLQAYPTTLFVDDQGTTLRVEVGSKTLDQWREIIDEVLADYAP